MAQKVMLKNAMKEMAAGSKKAFHTFYTGTAQYVYQSAYYLYANERSAREFMVDFYQYLYLHLPEYTLQGRCVLIALRTNRCDSLQDVLL